jgi:hypothetical protein
MLLSLFFAEQMNVEIKYLVESPEIEKAFLNRFEDYLSNISELLVSFGINPKYSWYLIEMPIDQLVPSLVGDVDILAGNLQPNSREDYQNSFEKYKKLTPNTQPIHLDRYAALDIARNGGLMWPPSLDYLVGVEVKCSYLPMTAAEISSDEIKSKKTSLSKIKGIRKRIGKLLSMGFNGVGLLELIADPPADGVGSQPWSGASYIARRTLNAMEETFKQRLPEDSPAGHAVGAISGVIGRDECGSGAFSFDILRQIQKNPFLKGKKVQDNRQEMQKNLYGILEQLSKPHITPAIYICDKKTHKLYWANSGSIWF